MNWDSDLKILDDNFTYKKLYEILNNYSDIQYDKLVSLFIKHDQYIFGYTNNVRLTHKTCKLFYLIVKEMTSKEQLARENLHFMMVYFDKNVLISNKYILKLIDENIIDLTSPDLYITDALLDTLIESNIIIPLMFDNKYSCDFDKIKCYIDSYNAEVVIQSLNLLEDRFIINHNDDNLVFMLEIFILLIQKLIDINVEIPHEKISKILVYIRKNFKLDFSIRGCFVDIVELYPAIIHDILICDYNIVLDNIHLDVFSYDQLKLITDILYDKNISYKITRNIVEYLYEKEILHVESLMLILKHGYDDDDDYVMLFDIADIVFSENNPDKLFEQINKISKINSPILYTYIILKYSVSLDNIHFKYILLSCEYCGIDNREIDYLLVKRFYHMFNDHDYDIKNIDEIKLDIKKETETKSARK